MSSLSDIVDWNISRNLNTYKPKTEMILIHREYEEFLSSILNRRDPVDDLCDLIVVATGALHKLGYDPDKAMNETYKEISSRKGEINTETGKWEKDLTQDPSTLYIANYELCKK
jgi:hypothetical protein